MTRRAMVEGGTAAGAASGLMVGFICRTAGFLGCFPGSGRPILRRNGAILANHSADAEEGFSAPRRMEHFAYPNGCTTSNVHEGEARCRKRSRWLMTTATF